MTATSHSPERANEGTGGSLAAAPVPRHPLVADADRMMERIDRALATLEVKPLFVVEATVWYDPTTDTLELGGAK